MTASAPSQPRAASAARTLGTIPPAMTPVGDEVLGLGDGQRVELAAVGVADAVDVGEQHQLAGAEPGRDAGRGIVGVDVADDALSSRASGATTGTWPPTRIASSRSRRRPTTLGDEPELGDRARRRAGRRPRRTGRRRRRRGRAARPRARC